MGANPSVVKNVIITKKNIIIFYTGGRLFGLAVRSSTASHAAQARVPAVVSLRGRLPKYLIVFKKILSGVDLLNDDCKPCND